MKHLQKFNNFNESIIGDKYRQWTNKDEKTAMGILVEMKDDLSIIDGLQHEDEYFYVNHYKFNIADFSIEVISSLDYSNTWDGRNYSLIVDDVTLDCSKTICKKILNRADSIFRKDEIEKNKKLDKEREEEEKYIKKDARTYFS